jgi:protease-4
VRRGRHATLFSSYEPWTEEEREKVHALNVSFYETFVRKAAEGRRKTRDEILAVAQGRVWTGEEAVRLGLVDRLGGLDVATALAREKAHIPKGQEIRFVVLPEKKGLIETLMERRDEDVAARALGPRARTLLRWATAIAERGPIARLPFDLSVR